LKYASSLRFSLWAVKRLQAIAAVSQTGYLDDVVDLARVAAAGHVHDDVDGFRDQWARHADGGLENQLLQPRQCAFRRSGVNRGQAPGMTGAPGLKQVECFSTAHFADHNPIGTQP